MKRAGSVPARLLLLGVATVALGCAEDPQARGAAVLAPFKTELQAALREGLERGPEHAIEVCRVRAPELAAEAAGPGVEIGRTSHRLRNPANAPRPWVAPLLAAFVADPAAAGPRTVSLPDGRTGYVEPIPTQAMCLVCHGETLAPAVQERLQALYPADEAVGFREGDLRGLFWAELLRAE